MAVINFVVFFFAEIDFNSLQISIIDVNYYVSFVLLVSISTSKFCVFTAREFPTSQVATAELETRD